MVIIAAKASIFKYPYQKSFWLDIQSLHIPLVLYYGYIIMVAKTGTLSHVATALVFTREGRRTHICTISHISNACIYGQHTCL